MGFDLRQNPGAYTNSIFMARLKSTWSPSSKLPWGQRVRFVGEAGAIHAETEALLAQHGVDHGDFPHTVLRTLKAFLPAQRQDGVEAGANVRGSKWKIPEDEIARRRDLRNQRIFTIDPTTARDLDDALSITPLEDGTVEIGVHIADVTYFVTPNSDLDREARRRATTVYLVQQVGPTCIEACCRHFDTSLSPECISCRAASRGIYSGASLYEAVRTCSTLRESPADFAEYVAHTSSSAPHQRC